MSKSILNRQVPPMIASIVLIGIVAGLFVAAWSASGRPVHAVRAVACMSNLKLMAAAAQAYADDHDGRLPADARWMDAILPYGRYPALLRCPEITRQDQYGYAFNSNLAQAVSAKIPSPDKTPLFYDSTNLGRNASDPVSSLPRKPRHGARNRLVYVDGHTKSVLPPKN